MRRPARIRLVMPAALLLSACAVFQRESAIDPPNDRNLAAIFLAANNTDISYGQVAVAPGRTTNSAVIAFATRMLTDHGALNRVALQLFEETGITPAEHVASLNFRDESAAKRDTLRELTGARFDSAYMVNEVRYHARLLGVMDSVMIPRARNARLKSMLTSIRPAVAAHLEHAQRVQAELKR
jgi:putative membrane protein